MADSRLQHLKRRQLASPSKDGQAELLAALKRSGALHLSKQNINLLASLGIEPIVRAFLNGPPIPRWMSDYPGCLIPTYKCLHGRRGCWSCFPHKHPAHDTKDSSHDYEPAEVGWAHLHREDDLAWVGNRIYKAGWKPSIIALSSLHNLLRRLKPGATGFASQADITSFIRDVEECVYAAVAVAQSNIPDAVAAIKVRAAEIRLNHGDDYSTFWAAHHNSRLRVATLSLLILEKNHSVPQIIWDTIRRYRADGLTVPGRWERASARPDRYGNRNKTFGPKPMFALLKQLVHIHTEHPPDKMSQIIPNHLSLLSLGA